MRVDYRVVLDACVLAPANLCDLLLRLAEIPRLYIPQWSESILTEVRRTQIEKLGFPEHLADSWQATVRSSFPEAMVTGYEPLIEVCQIQEKDRHVLAAAIRARAELIVTSNLKDFPVSELERWSIEVAHPANYLLTLYSMDPGIFVSKTYQLSENRGISAQRFLSKLSRSVPTFADALAAEIGWEFPTE